MLIRCEKCATLYELDDNMLPPGGAPVQCSRCQYVFTAYPDRRSDGGAAMPAAAANEEGAKSEIGPPAASARAHASDIGMAATGPTPDLGGEGADAGQGAGEVADHGPSALPGEEEPGGSREGVTAPGRAGPVLASVGEALVDGTAESSESAPSEAVEPRQTATAGAGGAKPRAAGRAADGQSQSRKVSDGVGADQPKFTADGRPIRKVPFPPDDAAALSPRTASARPSLQAAAPKGGERARLPWLVPVVVVLILAFAAMVAWRLLATRAGSEDAGHQPPEGHSSLLPSGHPQGGASGAPLPGGHSALAGRDGKMRSHSVAGRAG